MTDILISKIHVSNQDSENEGSTSPNEEDEIGILKPSLVVDKSDDE
jgi:hypothetical protein